MATSRFPTTQYTSGQFVESSGAILFDLSGHTKQVCLIHSQPSKSPGEWLLAKGRRNRGEPRSETALREVREETGYPCHLYPVRMATRTTGPTDANYTPDVARCLPGLTEPFMLTIRELAGAEANVKLIWWFIAEVDSHGTESVVGEDKFTARFMACEEALQRLTYKEDRGVLQKAISLVEGSEP